MFLDVSMLRHFRLRYAAARPLPPYAATLRYFSPVIDRCAAATYACLLASHYDAITLPRFRRCYATRHAMPPLPPPPIRLLMLMLIFCYYASAQLLAICLLGAIRYAVATPLLRLATCLRY